MSQPQMFVLESLPDKDALSKAYCFEKSIQLGLPVLAMFGSRRRLSAVEIGSSVINKTFRRFEGLMKLNPSLIHLEASFYCSIIALLAKRFFKIPSIVYLSEADLRLIGKSGMAFFTILRMCREANAVIVDYEETKSRLNELKVCPRQIRIVHPGVPERYFLTVSSTRDVTDLYQLRGKTVLLSLGLCSKNNFHLNVIEAVLSLLGRHRDICCLVVCSLEAEKDITEKIFSSPASSHFHVINTPPTSDLIELIHCSDIVVAADVGEDSTAIDRQILVASAASKCVLGSATTRPVQMIQDGLTGFIVDPGSHEDIAAKLSPLLWKKEVRVNLGLQGRKWADKFRCAQQSEKIRAIARSILAKSLPA